MRHRRGLVMTLGLLACALLATATADACDDFGGRLPYWGYGYSGSLYGLGHIPVPPYFAIHPPVYYSDRVYRPYGDSPFACGCRHHWHGSAAPSVVWNRTIRTVAPAATVSDPDQTAWSAPQVIYNPYVETQRGLVSATR